MTKKNFDQFIFDDDILGELPEFTARKEVKNQKRRSDENRKVLFRDNLSQLVEPVESFMLSIPRSDALDSQVVEELENDYAQVSNTVSNDTPFKKPVINIHSLDETEPSEKFFTEGTFGNSITSSQFRDFGSQLGASSFEEEILDEQVPEGSIELLEVEKASDTQSRSEDSPSKSISLSMESSVKGPNIEIRTKSVEMEDGSVKSQSKSEIVYEDKKGHYRFEKNGNVREGEIEADNYTDFLKKIYEPLIGYQSMSGETFDSSVESVEDQPLSQKSEETPSISTETKPNELIINISHEDEDKEPSQE